MIKQLIIQLEKIASYSKWGINRYTKPYETIVANEIALGEITQTDTVLNIGCGSIPFTAILLAQKTGCKVKALDHDKQAVKNAKRVVTRLNLSDLITVYEHHGESFDEYSFDKAILALQVSPLQEVLAQMDTHEKTIIIRLPFAKYQKHYDSLPEGYSIINQVDQPMKTFGRSVVVKKL